MFALRLGLGDLRLYPCCPAELSPSEREKFPMLAAALKDSPALKIQVLGMQTRKVTRKGTGMNSSQASQKR